MSSSDATRAPDHPPSPLLHSERHHSIISTRCPRRSRSVRRRRRRRARDQRTQPLRAAAASRRVIRCAARCAVRRRRTFRMKAWVHMAAAAASDLWPIRREILSTPSAEHRCLCCITLSAQSCNARASLRRDALWSAVLMLPCCRAWRPAFWTQAVKAVKMFLVF